MFVSPHNVYPVHGPLLRMAWGASVSGRQWQWSAVGPVGRVQVTRPPVWSAPHWSTLRACCQRDLPRKSQTTHSLVIFPAVEYPVFGKPYLRLSCWADAKKSQSWKKSLKPEARSGSLLKKGRRKGVEDGDAGPGGAGLWWGQPPGPTDQPVHCRQGKSGRGSGQGGHQHQQGGGRGGQGQLAGSGEIHPFLHFLIGAKKVREFLAETREVAARPSHTFRMDSLLSEMRHIEGRQLQPRWTMNTEY